MRDWLCGIAVDPYAARGAGNFFDSFDGFNRRRARHVYLDEHGESHALRDSAQLLIRWHGS